MASITQATERAIHILQLNRDLAMTMPMNAIYIREFGYKSEKSATTAVAKDREILAKSNPDLLCGLDVYCGEKDAIDIIPKKEKKDRHTEAVERFNRLLEADSKKSGVYLKGPSLYLKYIDEAKTLKQAESMYRADKNLIAKHHPEVWRAMQIHLGLDRETNVKEARERFQFIVDNKISNRSSMSIYSKNFGFSRNNGGKQYRKDRELLKSEDSELVEEVSTLLRVYTHSLFKFLIDKANVIAEIINKDMSNDDKKQLIEKEIDRIKPNNLYKFALYTKKYIDDKEQVKALNAVIKWYENNKASLQQKSVNSYDKKDICTEINGEPVSSVDRSMALRMTIRKHGYVNDAFYMTNLSQVIRDKIAERNRYRLSKEETEEALKLVKENPMIYLSFNDKLKNNLGIIYATLISVNEKIANKDMEESDKAELFGEKGIPAEKTELINEMFSPPKDIQSDSKNMDIEINNALNELDAGEDIAL